MDIKQYSRNLWRRARKLGIAGIMLIALGKLLEDRVIGWLNSIVDQTISSFSKYLLNNPFRFVWIIGILLIIATFVWAYIDTKKQRWLDDYKDIEIEYYEYPWTDVQRSLGVGEFINFLKIGLLVINKGNPKIHCGLRIMDIQYKGHASNNEWVPDPNPTEKKLLKWDEGYETPDGKIDISPYGGVGRILLAEANPHSPQFWFWYIDGKSQNARLLEGLYKVTIQVEADCKKEGVTTSIRPLLYGITFNYKQRKLLDISVSKISGKP